MITVRVRLAIALLMVAAVAAAIPPATVVDVVALQAGPNPAAADRGKGGETSGTSFQATVTHVDDGDTIRVLRGRQRLTIRLHGIDAPERGQAYGNRARQFTDALCAGATVTISEVELDQYGRTVAEVILPDGRSLNREVVRAGYAWWYRRYSDDPVLEALEADARRSGTGLWRDRDPVPPWEFRRRDDPQQAPFGRPPATR
jgi:endonuclease YncB( thermonuclease family)